MKLMSGESGWPFSGSSVTHSYSRRSPRWTVCVAVQQVAAAQAVDILVQAGMVTWFGDQQEREALAARQLLDEGLLGVKTVGDDNCRHAGIVGAEPLQHAVAGVYFAVLFVVSTAFGVAIAYELGSEREHLRLVRVDDGGLQDVMVEACDTALGGGEAVLAVDLLGAEVA